MGESATSGVGDVKALMIELEQLYLRDYAQHWSQVLGGISLVPLESARQSSEQAALLTAANSPLLKLLIEVRENTRLQPPEPATDEQDAASKGQLATGIADQVKTALLDQLPGNGKIALQRRFEAFHQLLDENNNPSLELSAALQALNNLHLQMATMARSSQPEEAAFAMAKSRMAGQQDAISTLRTSTARLPPPLNGWLGALADDSWRLVLDEAYRHVNERYQSELYSVYIQAFAKRYPFTAASESDVAIADFREFFKAQGIAERFFDRYLTPFIKGENNQYRLRSVDGRSLPISVNTLSQMGRMHAIRRSFFSEDPERPTFKFQLEPYSLDQNLSRADFRFGDKQLEYRHGPIVPLALQWPADADNGIASLIVEHPDGRRVGYQENTGPWSLFRLIERMETQPHSGRGVLMLKAKLEERRVNYLLMSQRSPNPFELGDLRGLRLPAVL
jgi:type VI secretion system protein ImpL